MPFGAAELAVQLVCHLAKCYMTFSFLITSPTRYGVYPVSYTHLDVYKRQTLVQSLPEKAPPPWRA